MKTRLFLQYRPANRLEGVPSRTAKYIPPSFREKMRFRAMRLRVARVKYLYAEVHLSGYLVA